MNDDIRAAIGRRIREWRLSMGMSQKEVADLLRLKTRQTVSGWERGLSMPSGAQWYELGIKTGASLDYLVYGIRTIPVSKYSETMARVFGVAGVQPAIDKAPAL